MANINISCIAIIGKQASNNPLYIKNFNPSHADLKYHYIAHTSCDVMDERAAMKAQDMYLGVLFSMEDLSVYGYMTNTKIKFITVLTVPDVIIKDLDMKNIFRRIHAAYVNHASNPFYEIDSQKMIKSKKFEEEIEAIGRGRALEGGNRNSLPAAGTPSSLLTPSQEHYLKKYLLGVLIKNELGRLEKNPYETLPNLGGPFDPLDKHADTTTPFLRYFFESIVVPFPFLTNSKDGGALWPKLQLFMEEWAKLDTAGSNGVEREEMMRRKRLKNKGERAMVLMYSMAIKTVEQRAKEKARAEAAATSSEVGLAQLQLDGAGAYLPTPAGSPDPAIVTNGPGSIIHGVQVNVAGIRVVKEKRHVREHEHAEFLIHSTLADGKEYIVARRHSHFRLLYHSLREEFPQFELPLPPARFTAKSGSAGAKAGREKDRISLRGYLHSLARTAPEVVSSSIFVAFLTKDTISLTPDEARNVQACTKLDEHRMEQQAKFDKEVTKKVEELDKQLKQVKMDLLQPGGVSRLFSAFGQYEDVKDLPPLYQTVFEWGCMNFASTLYHVFTASDNATLNFTQMKRTHMLLPYRTMWGILKITNPMAVLKGIMDLFLAQPFGSRSLMQRIISVNIHEEISEYKKDVSQLETLIGDQELCEKIHNYVYAPKDVVSSIVSGDESYDIADLELVVNIIKSDKIQPSLNTAQIKRVSDSKDLLDLLQAAKESPSHEKSGSLSIELSDHSDDEHSEGDVSTSSSALEEQPENQKEPRLYRLSRKGLRRHPTLGADAGGQQELQNLVRQLQQLLVTHLRIRDKEQMMGLVFQGVTGEIFKELISIFYEPLIKVYRSANVGDSLMDVKDFVDELIKIVEQADLEEEGHSGKQTVATLYLNLVKKHLPKFYKFVHSVHKQDDGLFRDLLEWIESIISFMRTGYARTRINYKTEEELQVAIDLDDFIRANVDNTQWEGLQQEAESLRIYFTEVKDRKREEIRHIAGLDRASRSSEAARLAHAQELERERVARELKGVGMWQEDVDELEMINYEGHTDFYDDGEEGQEGQGRLKLPKAPVIDTLREPFVTLLDKTLFQSARE
ncbi:hypothetical protein BGX28_005487 [Mortierella sp. GBA30]|nr:hypothetical protein BGX28_005487 [Mortierella sp. GBA30]